MVRWQLVLVFTIGLNFIGFAQDSKKISSPRVNDLNGWTGFKLNLKLSKKIEGKISQQFRLKSDLQRINTVFTNFSLKYDLPKKLIASTGVRFGYFPQENKFYRVYGDLVKDFKNIGRFDFDWRIRVQHEWETENKTEDLIRNKLKTSYNIKKSKFGLSLELEVFNAVNNSPEFYLPNSYRTTFSLDRKVGKKSGFDVVFALERSINTAPATNKYIIGATWSFSPKLKKKKKDKGNDEKLTK